MKKIFLFMTMALIALLYGCNSDSIIDDPVDQEESEVTDKVITITAMMPGENNKNALGGNTKTRIGLEQDTGGLDVRLTWETGDKLDILLKDGDNFIPQRGIEVTDIDETGKFAKFTVDVSGITGSTFNIYGIYGGGGLSDGNPALAQLPTAEESLTGSPGELGENMMLRFAVTEVAMANPAPKLSSVTFEHIGSLFSIQVNNAGTTDLTGIKKARLVSTSTDPGHHIGAYINSGGSATYNVLTGEVTGATTDTTLEFEIPNPTDLTSDDPSLSFWGWFIPTTAAWPEIKLELLDSSDALIETTADTKLGQIAATGKAFYFRSFWDTELSFLEPLPPFPADHVFPRLAEYNVSPTSKVFADSHANNASGFYFQDVRNTSAAEHCPDGWHLPTLEEYRTFVVGQVQNLHTIPVQYKIIEKTAYRYERSTGDDAWEAGSLTSHVKITGRYIGDRTDIVQATISDESWWTANNSKDVTRIFPAAGYYGGSVIEPTGNASELGLRIMCWTSTPENNIRYYRFSVTNVLYMHQNNGWGNLRCVKDL